MIDFFPVFPRVFSPGVCRGSLSWVSTSPVWATGCFWLLGAGSAQSVLSVLSLRHILAFVRCELESPLVPSLTAARLGLWSSGQPIASLPLVSCPWMDLCWSHLMSLSSVSDRFVVLPHQLVCSGVCSPASTICPTSRVVKRSSFGLSASVSHQVFVMRSPFRVKSVSVLNRNQDSSSTFLVFGWSLRDVVTLSGRVCLRSRSERRLFAHLP